MLKYLIKQTRILDSICGTWRVSGVRKGQIMQNYIGN